MQTCPAAVHLLSNITREIALARSARVAAGPAHCGNVALLGRVTACNSVHGGGVGGTWRMLVPPIVQFCLLRVVLPIHRPPTDELKQRHRCGVR